MLGIAVRIAQRMGCHSESSLAKHTVFEAEMRRRLWWSLVIFDTRIGELADFKSATLVPTWDCRIPLNLNDSDLRPEMKETPQVQGKSSEALFVVVRSAMGDLLRRSDFHLDFTWTSVKTSIKHEPKNPMPEHSELENIEKMLEEDYLKFCDLENPLHFMTIWMTRGYLARCRLIKHHARDSGSSESQREAAISSALNMIECDTKILASPLVKKFHWLAHFYMPFFAYIHVTQSLKRRPGSAQAERAWEVMSDNYTARFGFLHNDYNAFFLLFSRIVLEAWQAQETYEGPAESLVTPRIVVSVRHRLANPAQYTETTDTEHAFKAMSMGVSDYALPLPDGFRNHNLLLGMLGDNYAPQAYFDANGLPLPGLDVDQINWAAMDWDLATTQTGEANTSTHPSLHPY